MLRLATHRFHDVKISKCRLYHNDIRPLFDICLTFAQCFSAICRVHLIRSAITKCRSGMCRIPKRRIISGRKLCAVSHKQCIHASIFIQCLSQICDMSIHHVRRCDHVCARLGKCYCHLRQKRKCLIVQDLSVLHQSAMSVGGIFAQAHICDNQKLRCFLLDLTHRTLCDTIFIISAATTFILVLRDTEDQNCRNASRLYAL